MNRQQILSRLTSAYSILYSSGLLFHWQVQDLEWKQAPLFSQLQECQGIQVHSAGKWPLRWPRLSVYDKQVLAYFKKMVIRALSVSKAEPDIFYCFHPMFFSYVKALPSTVLAYHIYDRFDHVPGWTRQLEQAHRSLCDQADVIFCSSRVMAEWAQEITSENKITIVENGVDYELFAATDLSRPNAYADIHSPIILYAGNINRKIDLILLFELARSTAQWHWFFVGGVGVLDPDQQSAYDKLRHLSNVTFLGHQHHTDLPAFMAHSHVNIMPYRTDQAVWANSGFPLKLNEYLATGKPIVSTPLASIVDYRSYLSLAEGKAQWLESIATALDEDSENLPLERKKLAKANSWQSKVDIIRGELEKASTDKVN